MDGLMAIKVNYLHCVSQLLQHVVDCFYGVRVNEFLGIKVSKIYLFSP